MRRTRILYVQKPTGGGSATSLFELVRCLDPDRYETVILFHRASPYADRFRELGLRVLVLGGARRRGAAGSAPATPDRHGPAVDGPPGDEDAPAAEDAASTGSLHNLARLVRSDWPAAKRIARLIRTEGIDVVHHNNNPSANRASILAAALARVPQIGHVRYFARYFPPIDRILARPVDHFLFASAAVRDHCVRGIGAPAERGDVVHEPFDVERFAAAGRRRAELRAAFGIGPEDPVVANVGRLVAWKGQDRFLAAVAEVARTHPRAFALVVGAAPDHPVGREYEARLRRLAAELGIPDRVRFTGFRRDVPELMAAADVVVHSAVEPEPFGRVVAEAMAVGRPVVATAGGGVPEIVRDGETGLLVPLDDPRRMAEAIRMLLDDPELGRQLGARAQLDVRQRFAADRFADRIQAIYERVAAPTGGRRARAVHPGR